MSSPTRAAVASRGKSTRPRPPRPPQRGAVKFSEIRSFGGLQLLSGRYTDHVFAPHFHHCYSIGVVLDGGMRYRHCGHGGIARPGSIFLINPGEVHTAESIDGTGWGFRSFYLGKHFVPIPLVFIVELVNIIPRWIVSDSTNLSVLVGPNKGFYRL